MVLDLSIPDLCLLYFITKIVCFLFHSQIIVGTQTYRIDETVLVSHKTLNVKTDK